MDLTTVSVLLVAAASLVMRWSAGRFDVPGWLLRAPATAFLVAATYVFVEDLGRAWDFTTTAFRFIPSRVAGDGAFVWKRAVVCVACAGFLLVVASLSVRPGEREDGFALSGRGLGVVALFGFAFLFGATGPQWFWLVCGLGALCVAAWWNDRRRAFGAMSYLQDAAVMLAFVSVVCGWRAVCGALVLGDLVADRSVVAMANPWWFFAFVGCAWILAISRSVPGRHRSRWMPLYLLWSASLMAGWQQGLESAAPLASLEGLASRVALPEVPDDASRISGRIGGGCLAQWEGGAWSYTTLPYVDRERGLPGCEEGVSVLAVGADSAVPVQALASLSDVEEARVLVDASQGRWSAAFDRWRYAFVALRLTSGGATPRGLREVRLVSDGTAWNLDGRPVRVQEPQAWLGKMGRVELVVESSGPVTLGQVVDVCQRAKIVMPLGLSCAVDLGDGYR